MIPTPPSLERQMSLNLVGSFLRDAYNVGDDSFNTQQLEQPVPSSVSNDVPDLFTPSSSDQVAREAEIMLLRTMARTLETMNATLLTHGSDIGSIRLDVALVKERQLVHGEVKKDVDDLKAKISLLEARNTRQDGAYSLVTMLKDFGPWLFGLLVLAWGLMGHQTPTIKP